MHLLEDCTNWCSKFKSFIIHKYSFNCCCSWYRAHFAWGFNDQLSLYPYVPRGFWLNSAINEMFVCKWKQVIVHISKSNILCSHGLTALAKIRFLILIQAFIIVTSSRHTAKMSAHPPCFWLRFAGFQVCRANRNSKCAGPVDVRWRVFGHNDGKLTILASCSDIVKVCICR